MRDECKCLLAEGARRCGENQQCKTCGFNPDVAAKRKVAIRNGRKPKNLNDVLTAIDERIEYAKKRRDKENLNGDGLDIAYWRGRVDEAKSIRDALEKMGDDDNADA